MPNSHRLRNLLREWMELSTRRSLHDFAFFARKQGLSLLQLSVLFHIRFRNASGVSDIADDFGISKAAASQLIERLVLQDLIARTESSHDRRIKHIELTEKANTLMEESIVERQKWIDSITAAMNAEELKSSEHTMRLLIKRIKSLMFTADNGCHTDVPDFLRRRKTSS